MKQILLLVIAAGFLFSLTACSSEDPQFRIYNERTEKANVQIKTTGGNTININDIGSGQTTAYRSVTEGTIDVTAVIQNVSVSPTTQFFCGNDEQYTIVILAGIQPALRVD